MAETTLSKYLQFINELIDESRLAEAVAHSRHLLEQHPRHIDTYRSLGKALLEQGDYTGAVDIFQRVLSAAPADFIAHVGLAIVHKAGDRWKQALWHMERAFEVEPYNAAVRAELQDLYGRRDGLAPAQIELTRGALARLYVKGGLYQQAILELRELLAADPDRVDLKLLLAEAHWRAEERVEAAERCEEILELLPDCIEAHAMLADIMLATGDARSAAPHLEWLQTLTQLSQSTLGDKGSLAELFKRPGAPSLPREIRVERLSDADALGLSRQAEAAAWIGELDLEAETVEDDLGWLHELEEESSAAGPVPEEMAPQWLAAATTTFQEQPDEAGEEPPAEPEETAEQSTPEWLESVSGEAPGWDVGPEEPVEAPEWLGAASEDLAWLEQPVEAGTPDWLDRPESTGEPDEGAGAAEPFLPEWPGEAEVGGDEGEGVVTGVLEHNTLEEIVPGEGTDEAGLVEVGAVQAFTEGREPEVWEDEADREGLVMEERGDEQDEEREAQGTEEEAPDLDWLHHLGQSEPTTEPGAKKTGAQAGEAGELPDWLQDEGELDWLNDEEATAAVDLPERLAAESASDEDLSWLDQIAGGQAEPPEEMPTLEWPDVEELALPEEGGLAARAGEELPAGADAGLDWLDALASEDDADSAAWLDELAEDSGESDAAEEGTEPSFFSEDMADLAWLEGPVEQAGDEAAEDVAPLAPETEPLEWLTGSEGLTGLDDAGEMAEAELDEEGAFDWLTGEAAAGAGLDWLAEPESKEEFFDAALEPPDEEEEAEAVAADIFSAAEEEEPVLDWLEAAPEIGEEMGEAGPDASTGEEGPAVPADLEEAMAWLDDIPGRAERPAAQEVPEDLEEAMAWLEQLAAQQGAPLEELPSMAPQVEAGAPEDVAILDELPELELPGEEAPEPNLEWMEALAEVEEPELAPPGPSEDEFAVPGDLDEAMAWLEGLAEQEEIAGGELPDWLREDAEFSESLDEEPETAGATTSDMLASAPDDLDEALAWLEQLAAQQGAPAEELPSLQETGALSEEPAEELAGAPVDAAPQMEITPEMETPPAMQVPDVAMMYLDSLLAGGGQLAVSGQAAEETVEDLAGELPDDVDGALAWLEQLANEPVAEAPSAEELVVAEELASELDWLQELGAEPGAIVEAVEEVEYEEWEWTEQLPEPRQWEEDAPEAALPEQVQPDETVEEAAAEEWAWTEELPEPEHWEEVEPEVESSGLEAAAETEAVEWTWTEELPEPEQWEEVEPEAELPAIEQGPGEMFDEIPEDPDEAMAWLERLAARQGAPLDELPSVDAVSDEIETPAWLAREIAEAEATAAELGEAEPLAEEMDWLETAEKLEWLGDAGAEEALAESELPIEDEGGEALAPEELEEMEAALGLDILAGEEIEPPLPDWLAVDDESWESELTDIDSWLVAEEEASRVDLQVPQPERPAPHAPEPAPLPAAVPSERMAAPEGSDAAQLEAARAALDGGDAEAAIAAYRDYMRGGTGLNAVIADLEMEMAASERPMLLRLLGDAYMENGQLTRALEAYRRALDLL